MRSGENGTLGRFFPSFSSFSSLSPNRAFDLVGKFVFKRLTYIVYRGDFDKGTEDWYLVFYWMVPFGGMKLKGLSERHFFGYNILATNLSDCWGGDVKLAW